MEQQASYYDVTDLAQLPEPIAEIPGDTTNRLSAIYAEPSRANTMSSSIDCTTSQQRDFDSIRHWLTSHHQHPNGLTEDLSNFCEPINCVAIENDLSPASQMPPVEKQFARLKLAELSDRLKRHLIERGVGNRQGVLLDSYAKFSKKMAQAFLPKNPAKTSESHNLNRENANDLSDAEENYGFVPVPLMDPVERRFEKMTGFKLSAPPNLRSVRILRASQRDKAQAKISNASRPYSYYQGQIDKPAQPEAIKNRPTSTLINSSDGPTSLNNIQLGRPSLSTSHDLRRRPVVENYGQLLGLLPPAPCPFQDGDDFKGNLLTCSSLDQLAYSWRGGSALPSSRSDSGYGGTNDPKPQPFLDELTTSNVATMIQDKTPIGPSKNGPPMSTSILTLAAKLDEKEAQLEAFQAAVIRKEQTLTQLYEEKIADLRAQLACALAQILRHEKALGLAQNPARTDTNNYPLLKELEECRRDLSQKNEEISRLNSKIRTLLGD